MFETIINFFKKFGKHETKEVANSKDKAKERLHLVLMQDRANVSADFLEMMKQEIIEVIKKYIEVEENAIDVRLTNEIKEDGTTGAPSLYANIPILNIRNEMKKEVANVANREGKEEEKDKKESSTESKKESLQDGQAENADETKEKKEEKQEEKSKTDSNQKAKVEQEEKDNNQEKTEHEKDELKSAEETEQKKEVQKEKIIKEKIKKQE